MVASSHEERILALVGRFINVLSSSDIAVDDRHTPKLYSRFLAGLLARHTSPRQEKKEAPTIPKIESSSPDAPMLSLPDLSMRSGRPASDMSQIAQFASVTEPFNQPSSLSPAGMDDIYSQQSNTGGNTIRPYGVEDSMYDVPTDDFLASMQAINSPVWWEHVMMPGFTWPESATVSALPPGMGSPDQADSLVDPYVFVPHDSLSQHGQR